MSDWYCRGGACTPQSTYDADFNSVHGTLGQELGHRWGSFARFKEGTTSTSPCSTDATGCNSALLGRSYQHWSYYFDTGGSPMEGNDWADNSSTSFTLIPATVTKYSPLGSFPSEGPLCT